MPADADAPAPDGSVAPPPTPPRFCADCGAPAPDERHACPTAAPDAGADMGFVRDALATYFAILAVLGAAAVVALLMPIVTVEQDAALDLTASAAMTAVVFIAVIFTRGRLRAVLTTVGRARWYLAAPLVAVGTFSLATGLCQVAADSLDLPVIEATASLRAAGFPWAVAVVILCVQPAVVEELAFRGVITSSLEPVLGAGTTIGVTAFLFALIHLSPISFLHLMVIGLALGVLRRASGSLYPCILLHLCHNGLCLLEEALR